MSSRFAKQYKVPPEFPEILKDFSREVLRNQPLNINEFAAKYFDCLASGLPMEAQGHSAQDDAALDDVEGIVKELFMKYDKDQNYYLDAGEFQNLMNDLQARLDFPPDETLRFLAEADQNADGNIEYEEFIPMALQIIHGMYAKKRMQQHIAEVEKQAEDILVHDMTRAELTELIRAIFTRIDKDNSGVLNKQEFVQALTSMELGLTRREINTIMFRVDIDKDGMISYTEFIPFAYDLLMKLTSMRLLETELENDELAQYIMDLFRAKDVSASGCIHADDARDVLHQAMLGLSRMQLYVVLSEAEIDIDGQIKYASFVPLAVGIIKSMLSFESSVPRVQQDAGAQAEAQFYSMIDEALSGTVTSAELLGRMDASGQLDKRELQAARHFLAGQKDVDVAKAKGELWTLMKSIRRHKV